MNNICRIRRIALIATVGLFVMAGVGYGQDMQKGQIEATGQIGFVSGIGTHGAFGGSVGGAVNEHVLVYGEFLYIPLGSSTVSVLGVNRSVSARAFNFDGGLQYQFRKYGSMVPYAGVGLGLLHSTADISNNFTFQGLNFSTGGSSNDFYVNLGGGVRYYVNEQWGVRPEFTIFAGPNTFVRIGAGVFYHFGK
jgi:outer membrane protein with beta-barrel domain